MRRSRGFGAAGRPAAATTNPTHDGRYRRIEVQVDLELGQSTAAFGRSRRAACRRLPEPDPWRFDIGAESGAAVPDRAGGPAVRGGERAGPRRPGLQAELQRPSRVDVAQPVPAAATSGCSSSTTTAARPTGTCSTRGSTSTASASLLSRATSFAVFALGGTVVLAIVGASWTAIAAVLGAATFGISLALQDVGRSFVNGVYILVERPFRIGDHVRVGVAEGRVEDVGLRLTTLRTAAGDRIAVPNTVVFSSIIENWSVGTVDRQKFVALGIELPVTEIQSAVIASLLGTPHLSHLAPVVDVVRSSPDGTDIEVTVIHDLVSGSMTR